MKTIEATYLEIQTRYWRSWRMPDPDWSHWFALKPRSKYTYKEDIFLAQDNLEPALKKIKARIKKAKDLDERLGDNRQYKIVKVREIRIQEDIYEDN